MIRFYKRNWKTDELIAEFATKDEFNKFVEYFARKLEETTDTCYEKFLWDIHINDSAFEFPRNENISSTLYYVTDSTGKWYRKPGWIQQVCSDNSN